MTFGKLGPYWVLVAIMLALGVSHADAQRGGTPYGNTLREFDQWIGGCKQQVPNDCNASVFLSPGDSSSRSLYQFSVSIRPNTTDTVIEFTSIYKYAHLLRPMIFQIDRNEPITLLPQRHWVTAGALNHYHIKHDAAEESIINQMTQGQALHITFTGMDGSTVKVRIPLTGMSNALSYVRDQARRRDGRG